MSVRLDRLASDFREMKRLREEAALIDFEATGNPPDAYLVTFRCKGMTVDDKGVPRPAGEHRIAIALHADYPKKAPLLEQRTIIFHPNFAAPPAIAVCIDAWKWTAGETLTDLVLRLFNMVSYRLYNLVDLFNPQAVKWTRENASRLPLEDRSWAKEPPQGSGAPPLVKVTKTAASAPDDVPIKILKSPKPH